MTDIDADLVERLELFLRDYYREELGELLERYPNDQRHLTIDWLDLYRFDRDVGNDYLNQPDAIEEYLEHAIRGVDLPAQNPFDDIEVRVVGLGDEEIYGPLELTRTINSQGAETPAYVGVQGELSKVTTPAQLLTEAAFECQRCGVYTHVPQAPGGRDEPHQCKGCERNGPFQIDPDESVFEHFCKVRIQTPPDQTGELQQEHIDGFVHGDLVWSGHDEYGLLARSGEDVTVYGQIELRSKGGQGESERLYDPYLNLEAIEFEGDQDEVDIEAYRDEFEELAGRPDAVDLFAESIAPSLHATPEWEVALELLVAYLFGSPRIDVEQGPTIRGDIHALIISDYGMGKSMVNSAVAMYSPKCIKESVTGMSSDVALLAAAVEDDFGDGQWTLKPGILVRANGGHVILDEIDKTDADLERMNNALEGEQLVDINKAGQSATYKSRVGLLATGNPTESRFNPHEPISEQLDLDSSFLSRFDGIVTMEDNADEEQDANVAEAQGHSYIEAAEFEHGDREELDQLDRVVDPDLGRNWVAAAREECRPIPSREQVDRIRDWYAEEVRPLNESFAGDSNGGDMPVPASARVVSNTIRFAVAFARVHLREEVQDVDVERAMELSKALVGQNFDGEKFVPQEARRETQPTTQKERIVRIQDIIDEAESEFDGDMVPVEVVIERATAAGIKQSKVEHELEKLRRKGSICEPQTGRVRTV